MYSESTGLAVMYDAVGEGDSTNGPKTYLHMKNPWGSGET